jgi:hypothetical protein
MVGTGWEWEVRGMGSERGSVVASLGAVGLVWRVVSMHELATTSGVL